jgi:ABC-2 type transport system ATP-binding protein
LIDLEGVSRSFGDIQAADQVSFHVSRDEIVGFVGPNGAGKSTILKILASYLLPTGGRALIDGLDVTREPLAVRQRIGYLAGDTPLYQQMRADRFLRFVARARGLRGGELTESIDRVVEQFGLTPALGQRIAHCSTGFRQRLGLAAALVHDPPVLLLDEPTHGFDPLQVAEFRQLLRRLRAGRAILFSTHIISDVEAVSDRVLVINHGVLLGDGSLDELRQRLDRPQATLEQVFAALVGDGRRHG